MKPELTVVVPVYNEEACIRDVLVKWVAELRRLGIAFRILALNDGSKDRTGDILDRAAAEYPEITAVNKPNSGHGPTILSGYRKAVQDGPWVFQVDSDDEMGPESFNRLWAERENYDFLLGCRDQRRQAAARKTISFISRTVIRLFYGSRIWDVNAPYRLFRSDAFREVLREIPTDTFAPNLIISGFCSVRKLRVLEVPVPQAERKTGEVSIKKLKLFKASLRSFMQTVAFRAVLRSMRAKT